MLKAVGATGDTLTALVILYKQLEPARRRGEHGLTYAENDGNISCILCLGLILAILDEQAVPAARRDEVVEHALRWATRMLLTATPISLDPQRRSTARVVDATRCASRIARRGSRPA
jgi:hypothetical protein